MQRAVLELVDGRILAYRTFGAPDGDPVLALHGAPATSMMFEPADEIARSLNLKLICPDRPGYGGSSAAPDRGLHGWSEDVAALLSNLDIERFGIIGISGGGPYATTCAAHFSERLTALALVSPVGPMAHTALPQRLPFGFWLFFRRLPRRPRLLRTMMKITAHTQRRYSATSYRLFARLATPSDRPLLALPHVEANMRTMTKEAFATGVEGALADMQVYGSDWTVDAGRIRCASILWQGAADRIVPPIAAVSLGKQIPNCTVHVIPGAGHMWIYGNIPNVMTELKAMIAAGHATGRRNGLVDRTT